MSKSSEDGSGVSVSSSDSSPDGLRISKKKYSESAVLLARVGFVDVDDSFTKIV